MLLSEVNFPGFKEVWIQSTKLGKIIIIIIIIYNLYAGCLQLHTWKKNKHVSRVHNVAANCGYNLWYMYCSISQYAFGA